ncbi:MAG: adenylate/guanylate cyclase domain-containing protein, partial [Deltaproteobacteria bacterium]|nr:adenylate/guanylate cyclase domain-containing protein [Deltaproteobacteria bacterium]
AAPQATGGLRRGDRLLRAGDAALDGVGPVGFAAQVRAAAATRQDRRVPLTYARDDRVAQTSIALVPIPFAWRMLPLSATLIVTGGLVLARRLGSRLARAYFLLTVAYALHWTMFFGGPPAQTYLWTLVFFAASLVMLPLMLRAALLFPAEIAPPDGRLPWWPWLFAAFGPISLSWVYGLPLAPATGFRAVFAANVAFILTLLAVLTRNFRRAGVAGRRQLKWVVLGIYVGTVPVLLTDVVAAVVPALGWMHDLAVIPELAVPVCILIAVVRANALDIDRLITGAALYSLLSVLLLAALMIGVPHAARAAGRATDLDPQTLQLLLAVAAAALLVPAQRYLGPSIERLLFRERHALRAGVQDLLRDLTVAGDPEALLTCAGARLAALLRPQSCAIYAPLGDAFVPLFARRGELPDEPPALPPDAPALLALRHRHGPLDLSEAPRDAAAGLEPLGAAVLLPVRRGVELAAVICLGRKRSGDIYTATDLALLNAVADKLSSELQRFDIVVILRQERQMSAALRRYVPQPVVAQLTRGQSIEGGEREVAVLFVDLRGYTTYSETQDAGAVFSMLNRYTEAVSAVIERRGGTVVEFLGDGLMAVFGAPTPLPAQSRAAVEAAHEVVATVRQLALAPTSDGGSIAVGVGIASGRAFVGNIRTSDRLVYTAVGDVVNLASRIQGLTRELRAAIAIDASTHATAGGAAARFERHAQMRIRGRVEPVDVYALPAAAA